MHGPLHSGARYAAIDPKAAVECIEENKVLVNMAPHAVEDTGGYFVAITKEDEEYVDQFLRGLRQVNIEHREINPGKQLGRSLT